VKKQAIESHIISLSVAFEQQLNTHHHADAATRLNAAEHGEKRFTETLKSFFHRLTSKADHEKMFNDTLKMFYHRYDKNGDGVIDPYELRFLLKDVGEDMSEEKFQAFLKEIDSDGSGTIEFKEFAVAMKRFVSAKADHEAGGAENAVNASGSEKRISKLSRQSTELESGHIKKEKVSGEEGGEGGDDEEEEEEEVPEDLAHLPPSKQKLRILLRAGWMMGLGTAVVLLFSDPMVDVLSTLGDRFNIDPFYVAFVLAPIASNASELIASINYATKKTKKTITISLAALEGAACMNNTFCLGIFLCLIFGRGLVWEFSAETISIVVVELILFGFSLKRTHRLLEATIIIALYPLSIFLVWFLENIAGLN